jgi:hypothetical protein
MESGTALAEAARNLIEFARGNQVNLFIRTNSLPVDHMMSTEPGFTVQRLVGEVGYDKDYAAFYGSSQATHDLIRGDASGCAKIVFMTTSSVDLTTHGPHSRFKNTTHKQHVLKASRPCANVSEGTWKGAPIVMVTEVAKLKIGEGLSDKCVPVYDGLTWPEMHTKQLRGLTGIKRFIEDIQNGHVIWIIYSSREIEERILSQLKAFDVSIRRVRQPGAFAYILWSPKSQLASFLYYAPTVENEYLRPEDKILAEELVPPDAEKEYWSGTG